MSGRSNTPHGSLGAQPLSLVIGEAFAICAFVSTCLWFSFVPWFLVVPFGLAGVGASLLALRTPARRVAATVALINGAVLVLNCFVAWELNAINDERPPPLPRWDCDARGDCAYEDGERLMYRKETDVRTLTSGSAPCLAPGKNLVLFERAMAIWSKNLSNGIESQISRPPEGAEDKEVAYDVNSAEVVFIRRSPAGTSPLWALCTCRIDGSGLASNPLAFDFADLSPESCAGGTVAICVELRGRAFPVLVAIQSGRTTALPGSPGLARRVVQDRNHLALLTEEGGEHPKFHLYTRRNVPGGDVWHEVFESRTPIANPLPLNSATLMFVRRDGQVPAAFSCTYGGTIKKMFVMAAASDSKR